MSYSAFVFENILIPILMTMGAIIASICLVGLIVLIIQGLFDIFKG